MKTNGDSGQWRRAASSRLSVPTALTSKSSNGRSLARSCDGWAAQWMIRSGCSRRARGRASPRGRGCRASWCVKRVVVPAQALEVPGRVAVRAEEVAAHVVVDAVDLPAALVEERDRLRADEPAAAGDEDPLHGRSPPGRLGGPSRPLRSPWRASSPCGLAEPVGPVGRRGTRRAARAARPPRRRAARSRGGAARAPTSAVQCRTSPRAGTAPVIRGGRSSRPARRASVRADVADGARHAAARG